MSKPRRRKVTDTERLDFLVKHPRHAYYWHREGSNMAPAWLGKTAKHSYRVFRGPRQAIDAAIAASAKKGGRKA